MLSWLCTLLKVVRYAGRLDRWRTRRVLTDVDPVYGPQPSKTKSDFGW